MSITSIEDVEFGVDLPAFKPDTSLAMGSQFASLIGWDGPRFSDHEGARKEGLPGAMIPGVMSQGFLVAMIHHWAPTARVQTIDTVFRAPVMADEAHAISGVVTDIDTDQGTVEIDLTV
ncbi:MAG: hypothetical protein ACPHHQ_12030, partial [Pseudomonadales bacterium]